MATESSTPWPTRELILLEASRLFAVRGYRGTSTHDIAAAVGVRQPSLYKHFASKQEIAEELLRRDLTAGVEALERLASEGGGPAVELYRYLQWEVRYVRSTPFDLRALYFDEILHLPEFEEGRAMNARYTALLRSIIERGIAARDFLDLDVSFACQVVDAIVLETIRGAADDPATHAVDEPDLSAGFVLRGLLRAPSRLTRVRTAARTLDR
ncbi:MAG: TetR/AcrR family transcriptional regulator [Ilumatobacteraceae bacterium]